MDISISEQEGDLKEHHAGVPDLSASAEKRQDHPGDDGLDEEKEKSSGEHGDERQPAGSPLLALHRLQRAAAAKAGLGTNVSR